MSSRLQILMLLSLNSGLHANFELSWQNANAFEPTSQSISLPGTQASIENSLSQQSDKDEVNIDTTAMQTQSALRQKLTNVVRTLQSTVSSLFSSPAEIRQLVYFHILRPDFCIVSGDCCWLSRYENHTCKDDFAGCANFLASCSQVYTEAKVYLDNSEPFILIQGQRRSLFRFERDNGRPGHLSGSKTMTRIYTPPNFSELQICRLRRLCIRLEYAEHDGDFFYDLGNGPRGADHTSHFMHFSRELVQLTHALEKNHHIQTIRVLFGRAINSHGDIFRRMRASPALDEIRQAEVRKAMLPLVHFAIKYRVHAHAETIQPSRRVCVVSPTGNEESREFEDPLINWFNNAMIPTALRTLNASPYEWDKSLSRKKYKLEAEHKLATEKLATYILVSSIAYELMPECRKCYANFGTKEELREYLGNNPTHAIPFLAKKWNKISSRARFGAARSCPTCGLGFNFAEFYFNHLEKSGHGRSTVIPRYVCDIGRKRHTKSAQPKRRPAAMAFRSKKDPAMLSGMQRTEVADDILRALA